VLQLGRGTAILVGIDGGRGTPAVLGYAAELAARSGASLLVVHVASHTHWHTQDGVAQIGDFAECESAAVFMFPVVVEFLVRWKIQWRFAGASGDPARELARLAHEQGVGAVVVGASAPGWRHQLRRIGRGSVAAELAHLQSAPVIVLPEGCSRRMPATWLSGRLQHQKAKQS
jgi:nucleotide-binding universal stress UspA family protein